MVKKRKKKELPERNWIPISIIEIVINIYLSYFLGWTFSIGFLGYFYFFSVLSIWILLLIYVLGNILREKPDLKLKKIFSKIKKIEVYESWYVLASVGLIFALFVIATFSMFDKLIGTTFLLVLFGFWFAWIRDILKHKREKSS